MSAKKLTLVDCFGLGINGIIGSGIFILPAALQRRAGGQSPWAWLLVGLLCALVSLCFAEAASHTDKSGGPYRYATDAFGPSIGFGIGWVSMVSGLLGYAAVARGFADHAVFLVGRDGGVAGAAACALIVGGFGVINAFGIKPGARTGDVLSLIKLGGLLAFVLVGARHVRWSALAAAPSPGPGEHVGLVGAAFAGLFATTGFEYVPVPAGEAENPRRSMALVMPVSVVGATLLYVLIQVVAAGTLPTLGASSRPLVDAARAFSGPAFGEAIAVVAALSALGFCSSSAMVAPRYLAAFAEDAFLPRLLARRTRRYDSPLIAIAVVTVLVTALASWLPFTALADISNIAVVAQYLSTSLAVLVWHRRPRDPRAFRLPFGFVIPVLASLGSVLFLWQVSRGELIFGGVLGAVGLVFGVMTRTLSRRMK